MIFFKKKEVLHNLENQPIGTDGMVRLCDIIIPKDFEGTTPSYYKMLRSEKLYNALGHFDKPIIVIADTNENGKPNELILVDRYTRYLYAKQIGLEFVPVKYISYKRYMKLYANRNN